MTVKELRLALQKYPNQDEEAVFEDCMGSKHRIELVEAGDYDTDNPDPDDEEEFISHDCCKLLGSKDIIY